MREINPYNTSLTTAGVVIPPEHAYAAALQAAGHATGPEDLIDLLDKLGILDEAPA